MPFHAQDIRIAQIGRVALALADGTTPKQLVAASGAATMLTTLHITSTAAADHTLQFTEYDGASHRLIGEINIPAGAGSLGVSPVHPLDTLGMNDDRVMLVAGNRYIFVTLLVALQGAETIQCFFAGGGC